MSAWIIGAELQLPDIQRVACVHAPPALVDFMTTTPPAKTVASSLGSTLSIKSYQACPRVKSGPFVFPSHQFGDVKVVQFVPLLSERNILPIPSLTLSCDMA